jgi:hypothetical protein
MAPKAPNKKTSAGTQSTGSQEMDAKINKLTDWRGPMLARLRAIINLADPEIIEEMKWKRPSNPAGSPIFSHDGIVVNVEAFKNYVKMTFAKGVSLPDPAGLFNAPFNGNVRRAIDFYEGDKINEKALKVLIRDAVALNKSDVAARTAKKKSTKK